MNLCDEIARWCSSPTQWERLCLPPPRVTDRWRPKPAKQSATYTACASNMQHTTRFPHDCKHANSLHKLKLHIMFYYENIVNYTIHLCKHSDLTTRKPKHRRTAALPYWQAGWIFYNCWRKGERGERSDSPLCSSITLSLFHSRLKTYLFHKSYPRSFTSSSRTAFTDYCPDRFFWATRFLFLVFPYFLRFCAVR